jgi:hypothetical protein
VTLKYHYAMFICFRPVKDVLELTSATAPASKDSPGSRESSD